MDKKGGHVDWAISMSIFLVYIGFLVIFLKPGVEPEYKANTLITILENNLNDEINYTVEKTPLFVTFSDITDTACDPSYSGYNPSVNCDENVHAKIKITDELISDNYLDGSDFALLDSSLNYVPFRINLGTGINPEDMIMFNTSIKKDEQKLFYLIYSKDANYDGLTMSDGDIELNSNDNLNYQLGVTERIRGINVFFLDNLKNINCVDEASYSSLKEKWNFPKDFSIYYVNSTSFRYDQNQIIYICNVVNPPPQASTFVKEYKDFILIREGELFSILLNIKIW